MDLIGLKVVRFGYVRAVSRQAFLKTGHWTEYAVYPGRGCINALGL